MNALCIMINASQTFRCDVSPPERSKPDAEGERRRCVIGIWPIVDRPCVIIRPVVVRTMIAIVPMGAPDIAVCAEIRFTGSAGTLQLCLWRRGGRIDRCRCGNHERSDKGCPDQALHDGLLPANPDVGDIGQKSRRFQGDGWNRNRPAYERACSVAASGCRTYQRCQWR